MNGSRKNFIFYRVKIDSFRKSFILDAKNNKKEIKEEIEKIFFKHFYPNFRRRKNEVIKLIEESVEKPLIIKRPIWLTMEEDAKKRSDTVLNPRAIKIKKEILLEEEKLKQIIENALEKTVDIALSNFDFETKQAGIAFKLSLIRKGLEQLAHSNKEVPTYSDLLFLQTFSILIEKEIAF